MSDYCYIVFNDRDNGDFMSVLIKGMQMPESCCKCEYSYCEPISGLSRCKLTNLFIHDDNDKFPESCPLVGLPEHHGRLIDADELEPDADYDDGEFWAYSVTQVCNAQTMIEAEGVEE